jgi:hypothetical protein
LSAVVVVVARVASTSRCGRSDRRGRRGTDNGDDWFGAGSGDIVAIFNIRVIVDWRWGACTSGRSDGDRNRGRGRPGGSIVESKAIAVNSASFNAGAVEVLERFGNGCASSGCPTGFESRDKEALSVWGAFWS